MHADVAQLFREELDTFTLFLYLIVIALAQKINLLRKNKVSVIT